MTYWYPALLNPVGPCQIPCGDLACNYGCARARQYGWTQGPVLHGCVCPAGAEKTCRGPLCPRKPIDSAGSPHSGASGVGQGGE